MSNVRTLGKHACSAKMPVAWPHQLAFGFSAHLQKAWASQMLHKMPKHYIPRILELVKTHTMHVVFRQRKYPNIYVQGFYVARGRVERMLIQSNSDPTTKVGHL
jgi:hypothetical protein